MSMFELICCWRGDTSEETECRIIKLNANAASFASIPAVGDEFELEEDEIGRLVLRIVSRRWTRNPPSVRLFCERILGGW